MESVSTFYFTYKLSWHPHCNHQNFHFGEPPDSGYKVTGHLPIAFRYFWRLPIALFWRTSIPETISTNSVKIVDIFLVCSRQMSTILPFCYFADTFIYKQVLLSIVCFGLCRNNKVQLSYGL